MKKILVALILGAFLVTQAYGAALISSSQFSTANPELSASASQMITNLTNIYIKYKCDKTTKLDDKVKCSIISQAAEILSASNKKGEAPSNASGALRITQTLESLMTSFISDEEKNDYSYTGFIEPLKEQNKDVSENELVEQSIAVLSVTVYGEPQKSN